VQIGFLTEWQLYAQKIEGDSWIGEKLDPAKVEKMSREFRRGSVREATLMQSPAKANKSASCTS